MIFSSVTCASIAIAAIGVSPTVTFLAAPARPQDISNDGTVIVGTLGNDGFRWTAGTGVVPIVGPAADDGVNVIVSGDGAEISSDITDQNGKLHAARWDGGAIWTELPAFVSCDAFLLNAYDSNLTGDVIVGLAWIAGCKAHAFRWDAVNGTVDLGTSVINRSTRANAVDASGDVIVGWQDQSSGERRGARWNSGVQTQFSYVPPVGAPKIVGEALCVNESGTRVAGYTVFGLAGGNAWLWNAETDQTTLLPTLAGFTANNALPLAMVNDASIIVGTTGGSPFNRTALIWIDGQPQNLKTYIESKGGSIAPYTSLGTATGISADGLTIIGAGAGVGQPGGWIVKIPALCPSDLNDDGSVDAADLAILLGAWNGRGKADLDSSGTVDAADLAILLGAWGPCGG